MSNNSQFFLTLPSNSSMDYFPKNTVTNYTTHLPREVRLDGEWEVALAESHYPCSFQTVTDDECVWIVYQVRKHRTAKMSDSEHIPIKLKPGYYKNINELLNMMNNLKGMNEYVDFEYDKDADRVKVTSLGDGVVALLFSHSLSLQLGFEPHKKVSLNDTVASWSPDISMGLPTHMYVYCDLIEPQLIGDATAPLLKIVNVDREKYTHGAHKTIHYTSPHYVPLMKGTFETIEVDLRDHTGKKLSFLFGTSYVKLHFRRVQQR